MNHLEQQIAGLRQGLTDSGIPADYHKKTLHEFAPDLYTHIADIVTNAREGRGLLFEGGAQAHREAMLVARALFVQRVGCLVVPLTRLVKWLDKDTEELARAEDVPALFVLGFVRSGENPLTPWQRNVAEDFIRERIDKGLAFFAQVSRSIDGSRWWSPEFVEHLFGAVSVRQCGESGAIASKGAD